MNPVRTDPGEFLEECIPHPQLKDFEKGLRDHPDYPVIAKGMDDVLENLGHPCHFCDYEAM